MNEDKHLSPAGEAFIKREEDANGVPVLKAYDDGTGTWTGPWGTTHGVKPHQTFTIEQAQVLFDVEILDIEKGMRAWLTREITQGLWDALVSFGYNNGWGKCGSLKTAVNSGDWAKTQAAFMLFVHAYSEREHATVVWPGLVKRRKDELALWYQVDKAIGPQTEQQVEAKRLEVPVTPAVAPAKPSVVTTALNSRTVRAGGIGAVSIYGILQNWWNGLIHYAIPPADGIQGLVDQTQSSVDTTKQLAGLANINIEHVMLWIVLAIVGYMMIRRVLDKREQAL